MHFSLACSQFYVLLESIPGCRHSTYFFLVIFFNLERSALNSVLYSRQVGLIEWCGAFIFFESAVSNPVR